MSGHLLRAAYLLRSEGVPLRVGLKVPMSLGSAVRRNRMKRLMREALRSRRKEFVDVITSAGVRIDIVFQVLVTDPASFRKLSLRQVEQDVEGLIEKVSKRLTRGSK